MGAQELKKIPPSCPPPIVSFLDMVTIIPPPPQLT